MAVGNQLVSVVVLILVAGGLLAFTATTLSLVHVCSFAASATGALSISLTLALTDSFAPFLFLVAGAITVGSILFLFMPKSRDVEKIG